MIRKNIGKETLIKYNQGKEMYLTGEWSITKIAKELKMSRKWFTDWLKIQDEVVIVNRQNQTTCREDRFDEITTEEEAYWLGFLYADGWVSASGNSIELMLTKKDENHIEKFRKFLNLSNIIQQKTMVVEGKSYGAVRVSFKSEVIREQLINLGCTPRKTFTVKFPTEDQVPTHLIRHFIRGYIDGDGSLTLRTDPTTTARFSINGTYDMLTGIIDAMGWHKTKMRHVGDNYAIAYGGVTNAIKLLIPVYNNSKIHLERKNKIYLEMISAVYGECDIQP